MRSAGMTLDSFGEDSVLPPQFSCFLGKAFVRMMITCFVDVEGQHFESIRAKTIASMMIRSDDRRFYRNAHTTFISQSDWRVEKCEAIRVLLSLTALFNPRWILIGGLTSGEVLLAPPYPGQGLLSPSWLFHVFRIQLLITLPLKICGIRILSLF